MNHRIFIGLIIFCALIAFTACKGASGGESAIVIGVQASPISLDPRVATDAEGDKIANLLCEGLFVKNEKLEAVPAIAEKYETLSDVSYRFYLRPDVKFYDGSLLTADDVVYTFKSVIDGVVTSPLRSSFEKIKDVVAESQTTVRIDLKEPYAPFLSVMLTRGIVSKKAAEANKDTFGKSPVCAGPYKVVRFVPDSVTIIESNPLYFGVQPTAKKLEFQVIKDDNIRVLKLIKGDIDLVQNAIPPMLVDSVLKNKDVLKMEDTGIVMSYMGFNLTDPVLSKKKVREAIAYAIDRDEIISHRWKGMAVKANSILSPSNWAYDPTLMQYNYDPEKAKKLLDEAQVKASPVTGKRFSLVFKTSTVKDRIDIARMIAHQLDKVGIDVRVEPYEWGTFFRDVKNGNFQIYSLSWVGVIDPDIFYDVCDSSQAPPNGLNRNRYKNPQIDSLLESGRREMDVNKRKATYASVQKILLNDLPFVPLWYEKNVVLYRKNLSGVSLRPDASYRTFMNVKK